MNVIKIDKIIRSKRRSLALVITQDGELIARAPLIMPQRYIENFALQKCHWISRKLEVIRKRIENTPPKQFIPKEKLLSLREECRLTIMERTRHYAKITNLHYTSIKITSAKKRLGSCSATNNLNFTWRLIMMPLWVLDYVVVHELAHIAVKNHSKKFWNLVASIFPRYKEAKKWLRANDRLLYYSV